ncbi:YkgJ family cysteine cluster protein [Candidatus Electronema sp. JC]|uniref:YkgJ family cysteine cluster protein n=1 Tax=Candidatus Electronema sp. JC TaxID=3401570 RepID=UPI003B4329EF
MPVPLPDHCHPLAADEQFRFSCHPGVACFTECCRQLDLALTPHDVLRLKKRLNMDSGSFLEQYVIVAWEDGITFPACFLTMVDDGRESCVFVTEQGCGVYADRPAACRAYPAGRGVMRRNGRLEECFVLLREPHCLGFAEQQAQQTAPEYFRAQGLEEYNRVNDELLRLHQHPRILAGFRLSQQQLDQYIMALYNLDFFRQEMADGRITMRRPLTALELRALADDDEELLLLGLRWLLQEYFNEISR